MCPVSFPWAVDSRAYCLVDVQENNPKVKIKVRALDIALFAVNHHLRSAQVWHVFSRDLTVLPAHPHVHPQSE